MVRKKQKNIFEQHRNSNPTSTTSHEGSQSITTPEPTRDDIMDLSLPASPQASRPGTPQDFDDATSSNCQDLLRAAMEIKALAPGIEKVHSQISDLLMQGLTDPNDPVILEKSQFLERLNGYYQQAKDSKAKGRPNAIPLQKTVISFRDVESAANISQRNPLEITPPAHIPTLSNNSYNECLNLITQTIQHTIQALTQLVQQINYLNVQNPPPTTYRKNESNTKLTNSKIKKALIELLESYEGDEE
ncbi:hypothetical protein TNCV_4020822 [Trichonephila clavipes]|nr:hypothetical protein TNCV_4020822 [Trichonephila clavipes]